MQLDEREHNQNIRLRRIWVKSYIIDFVVRHPNSLRSGNTVAEFHVEDYSGLDFRVAADSPAVKMGCYPQGPVPGVRLGTFSDQHR